MPRRPRLHLPRAFYHLTLRGNHRQDIFFASEDRVILGNIVAEVINRFGARLHAYCWMTNQVLSCRSHLFDSLVASAI